MKKWFVVAIGTALGASALPAQSEDTIVTSATPLTVAQAAPARTPDQQKIDQLKGAEKTGQRDDTPTMTAAQSAQYRADYQAAKTKWAAMTPQEQAAAIASARTKKISELTAIERVGQRDDMVRETAAQSGALKAESDAAKASWDKMTAAQKQAVRKASWQKKRADLSGIERVGQRDDTDILPW
jgi:hypothetical protein